MTITQNTKGNKLVLTISGKFDYSSRKTFQDSMDNAEASDPKHIILDLTPVPFMDSAGLGLLALAQQKLKNNGKTLTLVAPEGYVLKILTLANFHQKVTIASTVERA